MSANWIDVVIAAVMLLSVTLATLRGFMYSAFGLAAVVVAFALALAQGGILLQPINHVLESPGISGALSHAIVFVAALVVCGALGKIVRKTAHKLDLGGLDRFGGFLFGAARGGLIAVVVVLIVGALPIENSRAWKESELTPVAGTVAYLFLGKGGMLETSLWTFDERRRPSLKFLSVARTSLTSDEDSDSDSDENASADSPKKERARPRKEKREARREARRKARQRESGEAEAEEEKEENILNLNEQTNRQLDAILGQSCEEGDGSCAE